MDELRRRLRDMVDTRYGGSAREASLALGSNPNLLGVIFSNEKHIPRLDTLADFARTYGWRLCDVVYWALDLPAEEPPLPPLAELEQALARLGVPAVRRQMLGVIALDCARAPREGPAPSSE